MATYMQLTLPVNTFTQNLHHIPRLLLQLTHSAQSLVLTEELQGQGVCILVRVPDEGFNRKSLNIHANRYQQALLLDVCYKAYLSLLR